MDIKLKAKIQVHKQYDWRFWFKLICAIVPLASIIIFLIASGIDLYSDPVRYWKTTLGEDASKYNPNKWQDVNALKDMTTNQMGAYLFCRNILMITTLGNIANAAFFINSAFNNKYEGQGKWDNQVYGTMHISTIVFIVLFYNLSLAISNNLGHMHWYNWMSWMCEHMVPSLLMMIYFFVFYPKFKHEIIKDAPVRNWFAEMGIAISMVIVLNIFFIILGYILRAAHSTRIFGEMSWSGYFPYPFYNFLNENKQVVGGGTSWVKPWMEFLVVMIIQIVEQVASFAAIHAQNRWQEKRLYGRLFQEKQY